MTICNTELKRLFNGAMDMVSKYPHNGDWYQGMATVLRKLKDGEVGQLYDALEIGRRPE